ncbi:hypothetical protein RvY_16427 [Ramazzottius varieornatus]|uniref:Glutathione S-transferase C-terminal domain-containing protein n=1 Tax=Ramazzottius varieornatus TaxID=947166 RepID=A0A1D1VYD9_RAMVA|nr:hypothetical protein RvY_16427 [Ramazzottius varieornatus]
MDNPSRALKKCIKTGIGRYNLYGSGPCQSQISKPEVQVHGTWLWMGARTNGAWLLELSKNAGEAKKQFVDEVLASKMCLFEHCNSLENENPFRLGDSITYSDFALFAVPSHFLLILSNSSLSV